METSDERIEGFIGAWEEAFGEQLSPGQARLQLGRLVTLYRVLAEHAAGPPEKKDVGDFGDVGGDTKPLGAAPSHPAVGGSSEECFRTQADQAR